MGISCTVVKGLCIVYGDITRRIWRLVVIDKEWQARVKGMLKAELKRRNVTYKDLADRLEAMGVHESERNINNKISRGRFSATFFIQCLIAAGCKNLLLEGL